VVAKDGCFICFNCGHKSRAGTLYSRRKSRIYRVNHPACDIIFYIIHTLTPDAAQCSRGSTPGGDLFLLRGLCRRQTSILLKCVDKHAQPERRLIQPVFICCRLKSFFTYSTSVDIVD
jgi:hypothetical protein